MANDSRDVQPSNADCPMDFRLVPGETVRRDVQQEKA